MGLINGDDIADIAFLLINLHSFVQAVVQAASVGVETEIRTSGFQLPASHNMHPL